MQKNSIKLISARRPEYDVIDEVKVCDGEIAAKSMVDIFKDLYPASTNLADAIFRHADIISKMYTGEHPHFRPCDTLYHDLQHTMDVSLCATRMLYGYETLAPPELRLGPELFSIGILAALYHDSGYILHKNADNSIISGASVTAIHVARSSELMKESLSDVSEYTDLIDDAAKILHYTGYEQKIEDVVLKTPALHTVGKILGSADLLAQAADRCYLEKCRDRLFPEFVMGGFDYSIGGAIVYDSSRMLLVKTPLFYRDCIRRRLEHNLNSYYHYAGVIFGGINHYAWWMENNFHFLQILIDQNRLDNLNRRLPFTYGQDQFPFEAMKDLMEEKKKSWSLNRIENSRASLGGG